VSLDFVHPWLLAAAVPLTLAAVAIHVRLAPASPPWGRLWAVLEWGALGLLVLALAQPQWGAHSRPETVLVIDRSASIDAKMRATEDAWVRAVKHTGCPNPCRVVQFAAVAQPLPASPAALAAHAPPPVVAGATDIETGVDTALGLLPHGGRGVILSDGWQTAGDPLAAAARARAAHIELDYVRVSDPSRRDAAITSVHAPSAVHAGDPLPLQITVRSTVNAPATLSVVRDGLTIGSQTVRLRTGENPFLLSYTAPGPGWHSFDARIALSSDAVPMDDALATTVDVVRAPRVLEVAPAAAASGSTVASILRRDGVVVTSVTPADLPATAALLARQDVVVLDDVPAAALDHAQVGALTHAVATGGLGLVVLGGPHSFSLGGYAHTGLEGLLPVSSLVPGNLQRGNVAIELVLDHSGSMIDLLGGVPKIQAVHIGAAAVARYIAAHHDDLGIVDFDIAPHVLVPMQRLTTGATGRKAIAQVDGLQANGGTNIYAGLSAGLQQLRRSNAPDKHMVLMTDGISEAENYAPLLATLSRDHVQVATVALGSDADQTLLRRLANATGGHFYYVTNAHSLPAVFYRETQFAVQPVRVSGDVGVTPGADSPVIRSLIGHRLPALSGNVITTLKPGAQADLLAAGPSSQRNPALAQWQDGAGRVVAFTPGVGARFAASWSREGQLWNDAVRWVERGVPLPPLTPTAIPGAPPSLEIDLAPAGARAFRVSAITGELRPAAGAVYPVAFMRVGPSLYQAALPGVPPGVYGFGLVAQGVHGLGARGLIAVPYSLEYLPRPADDTPLGPLAALTGGHTLNPAQPGWLSSTRRTSLWWALALAALTLFLLSAFGRQLDRRSQDGRQATNPASPADGESAPRTGASVSAGG
jgi:Ca-activated chloride channel homolog